MMCFRSRGELFPHFAAFPFVDGIQLSQVTSTGEHATPVQPHIRSPFETAAP